MVGSMATRRPCGRRRPFGDFLQLDVERQLQVVAGDRRDALQAAHRAAAGVDLDLLVAGFAVQFEFVMLFQAGLADMVSALVVGQLLASRSTFRSRSVMRPM